jgi:hypothetical protein
VRRAVCGSSGPEAAVLFREIIIFGGAHHEGGSGERQRGRRSPPYEPVRVVPPALMAADRLGRRPVSPADRDKILKDRGLATMS